MLRDKFFRFNDWNHTNVLLINCDLIIPRRSDVILTVTPNTSQTYCVVFFISLLLLHTMTVDSRVYFSDNTRPVDTLFEFIGEKFY